MVKHFSNKFTLILGIVLLTFTACSDDSSNEASQMVENPINEDSLPIVNVVANKGELYELRVDSASFVKLKDDKMVFQFTYQGNDSLTMHGWKVKGILGNSFDSIPDIKLLPGAKSGLTFGPNVYFGNILINKGKDIKKIKDDLKKYNGKFVLFIPKKLGHHISYDIFITTDINPLVATGRVPTDIDANPSPPKEW